MYSCVLFLMMVSAMTSISQVAQEWVARFHGSMNSIETQDYGKAVAVDKDGNVIVVGWLNNPSNAFIIVKYNSNGDSLWSSLYKPNGDYPHAANAVVVDAEGNIYVTGESQSQLTSYQTLTTIKYSPSGEEQWVNRFEGVENVFGKVNALCPDGSVCAAGDYSSLAETDYDYVVVKYTLNGDTSWTRRFNGGEGATDFLVGLVVDAMGNSIVTGHSTTTSGSEIVTVKYSSSGDTLWSRRTPGIASDVALYRTASDKTSKIIVCGSGGGFITTQYSAIGEEEWQREFFEEGVIQAKACTVDPAGNVAVTGSNVVSGSGKDFLTLLYSSDGMFQWSKRYSSPGNAADQPYDVVADTEGTVYITGESRSTMSGSSASYGTIAYRLNGDSLWFKEYNGLGNDYDSPSWIAIDADRNVYVTGVSAATHASTSYDIVTVKYSQAPLSVAHSASTRPNATLEHHSPNPVHHATCFRFTLSAPTFTTLSVYNLVGELMDVILSESLNEGKHAIPWDASQLESGAYYYQLTTDSDLHTKCFTILN